MKTLVSLPPEITQGAMKFMNLALGLWFDCFEELQRDVGYDLRAALREENLRRRDAMVAPAQSIDAGPPAPSAWKQKPAASPAYSAVRQDREPQTFSGWWSELARGEGATADAKLSITCSGADGCHFVSFCEAGFETFGEREDPDVSGLFAKIAGPHSARQFVIPQETDREQLNDALAALHLWVDCVPPGAAVLLAMVGIDPRAMSAVLSALSPLGVPRDPPNAHETCRALAAVGIRPRPGAGGWYGQPRGNHKAKGNEWRACHASSDVAYASMFFKTT